MNKLLLYIAMSQDGFIADKNGNVDWLPSLDDIPSSEIFGYKEFIKRIDTILMGSKSFKQIIEFGDWMWHDKNTVVFSSQALRSELSCVTITNNRPVDFMNEMKCRNSGGDIWLLGGAELVKSFSEEQLIDEIILTITPQVLGDGIYLDLPLDSFRLQDERRINHITGDMIEKYYLKAE